VLKVRTLKLRARARSSATNVVKAKGKPFLKKFIEGPIKIRDLITADRFAIYKVRSPELVVNIYSKMIL